MKKILLSCLIAGSLFADTISIHGLAFSKHKADRNENHKLFGVSYKFYNYKDVQIGTTYLKFKNSYDDYTDMALLTAEIYPLKWRNIEIGTTLAVGIQKGYKSSGLRLKRSPSGNDKGFVFLPDISIKANDVLTKDFTLHLLKLSDGYAGRLELELMSW